MSDDYNRALIQFLSTYVTDHKKALIKEALSRRTQYLTVVLEDIYHPHNASAVVRTCDCFGIQDLYVIEGKHRYEVNPKVVHGASKWVDIYKYEQGSGEHNTKKCFEELKSKGYRILATSPVQNSVSIHDVTLEEKTALVFGTEVSGISAYAAEHADELVHIPMYGFTESFNISVSAALCMNVLRDKLLNSKLDWNLSDRVKETITLDWYKKIVNQPEVLEKAFLRSYYQ